MLISFLANRVTLALGATAIFAYPAVDFAVSLFDHINAVFAGLPF